ncbi:MAG: amidohydrolase [Burkholderiales bacterium]|nr:amidohydrolase [Burkholderiales bacterium]
MRHAETIFRGGRVITMDEGLPVAEAVAIVGGRIVAVGTVSEIESLAAPRTRIVDLEGGVLMPGFIEAHGHPATEAIFSFPPATDVRPFFCERYEDVIAKIRERASKAPVGEFLFFRGLDAVLHRLPRAPTYQDLDQWAPDNPIVIQANSGHAAWANSAALAFLGIGDDTPDPPGGHYQRDSNGRLTGKAVELGVHAFLAPLMKHGMAEFRKSNVLALFSRYASHGLTMASDQGFVAENADLYRTVAASGEARVRIRAYVRGHHGTVPFKRGEGDDSFRVIGVKLTADGSPWVGNIAVSEPYLNTDTTLTMMGLPENNRGGLNWADEKLQKFIDYYSGLGWQLSVHAHGDRAVEQVLRCYAQALENHPRTDHRFRIEHCGAITDAQINRAVELGVLVSFFPAHVYWWGENMRHDMFNLDTAERWMPMRSAERAGMRFSLHNDGMVTPPNPLLNIRTAVTRLTRAGNVLGAQYRITLHNALKAHTINAAYQLFMEHESGSISPGKSADFVWLGADPYGVVPERLHEIPIRGTWLRGKPTYTA